MKSGHTDNRRRTGTPARAHDSPLDGVIRLAVGFLARRDHTVAQVQEFLAARGTSPHHVKEAIRRLTDLRYLSDQAYAQRWVDRRLFTRPMGPERLKAELQAKGIPDALAGRVVAAAFRTVKEDTLAHRALQGKYGRSRGFTPAQIERFLRQRGFEEETIDRVTRAYQRKEERVHEE